MQGLTLECIGKRFGSITALADVSLNIPVGSLVCLLGPSGCGKTTLLRIIAGLEDASEGRLFLDDEDQTEVPVHKRGFGMVFQSLALFPHLSVAENIAYPLRLQGASRSAQKDRVRLLLDLVQLHGIEDRRIHQLSGGQRQRVAIARGLATDPRLFLLDEPLSALDANLREHMQMELRLIQQRLGVTTLVVTHDQREAMTMADLVIVLNEGRVQQMGAPMEIYRDPANAFVAGFIGTSNLLPCTVDSNGILIDGRPVVLSEGDRIRAVPGSKAVLSVRPEDVKVLTDPARGELQAYVTFLRDLGESSQIVLDAAGHEIIASFPPRERPSVKVGDEVGIAFQPGQRVVLPA